MYQDLDLEEAMWLKYVLWHMPVVFCHFDSILIKARTRPMWAWFGVCISLFQGAFCSLDSSQNVKRVKYVVVHQRYTGYQLLSEGHGSHIHRFWTLLFSFMSQTFLKFRSRFKLDSSKLLPSLEIGEKRRKVTLLMIKHYINVSGQLLRKHKGKMG